MSSPFAATLQNIVNLTVRSGETGEELFSFEDHNDISDDLLAANGYVYIAPIRETAAPYCFLLKDGPDWASFVWDRRNPWAPYCATPNNLYNGGYDATADPHWRPKAWSFAGDRHRLFFQWTKLADDLTVKALGLTGWDSTVPNFPNSCGIVEDTPGVFVPQSLIILPTAITVKGRKGGTQVPDILEVSYYLSVVGVN